MFKLFRTSFACFNLIEQSMSQNKNNPGLGIEFEVLLPAYFCLNLLETDDVEDFGVESNAKDFGNVDDLIFRIKRRDQSELFFALQLKHADDAKSRLYPSNFWSKDDSAKKRDKNADFKLIKYARTFSEFDDQKRKYHIILFTNKTFDPAKAGDVQNFTMQQNSNCEGRRYFDTASDDGKSLYKFSLTNTSELRPDISKDVFEMFLEKFSLYTSQCCSKKLETKIIEIFSNSYNADELSAISFMHFFRSWHNDEFTDKKLTKKLVQVHLIQILLSNCIDSQLSINCGNNEILKRVFNFFDITLIATPDFFNRDSFVNNPDILRRAKDFKIVRKDAQKLTLKEYFDTLMYTGQKAGVVMFNDATKNSIYTVLNKNLEIPFKMIICGRNVDVKELQELRVFMNLRDLYLEDNDLFSEVLGNFEVSLQGRGKIKMKQVIDEEVSQFISVEDLLKSSSGGLIIGNRSEAIEHYVPRILEAICISFEFMINLKQDLVVISCGDGLQEIELKLQRSTTNKVCKVGELTTASSEEFNAEYKSAVILTQSEAEMEIFSEFQGNTHFLKALDEDYFQWISTRGDIVNLRSGCKSKIKEISEEDVCSIFKNNNANVICAEPGMGKSVLMEVLKKYSPTDHWAVKIDFRECSQIFKAFDKNRQWEDLFYKKIFEKDESIQEKVEDIFMKRKKIYLFFDGLDELQSIYIETAIKFLQTLISRGFKIWISSRRNLQDFLETRLNVLALNIQEFSEKTQKNYIKNRLSPFYDSKQIHAITQKIFENAAVFNNCEILGIPLQLSMLTEILIQDRDRAREFNEKIFVMTEMFESFFEGKITHYLIKITSNIERLQEDYKKFYSYFEIAALKSCLDESFYKTLKITESRDYREFIETDPSRLGIITKITEDGVPVFQHNTYAEYFAACYFAANYESADIKILFETKYKNIRLMFDIKLAEDSLLHLAVIYKDFDRLKTLKNEVACKDKGGRTLLHLACCYGEKFPLLDVQNGRISSNRTTNKIDNQNLELNYQIIKYLHQTKTVNPLDRDKVFKCNSLKYSDTVLNLSAVDIFLGDEALDLVVVQQSLETYLSNYESVIYYATKYNFKNIFKTLKRLTCLFRDLLHVKCLDGESLLHVAAESRNVDMIKLLIDEGVSVNTPDGYSRTPIYCGDTDVINVLLDSGADIDYRSNLTAGTPLQRAIVAKKHDAVTLLLNKKASVNATNFFEETALHLGVKHNNLEAVRLLLAHEETDVECKDAAGNTPLLVAAESSNRDIFELLLTKNADLNAVNNLNQNVLHLSARNKEIFELVFKLLSKQRIHVNNVTKIGSESVLHRATLHNNLEAVKMLIVHEEIDVECEDDKGNTPLHYAAAFSSLDIFQVILERGGDLNARNRDGKSVLHSAAEYGNTQVIDVILNLGLGVNDVDNFGRTPLYYAALKKQTQAIRLLVRRNADVLILPPDLRNFVFYINK